MTLEQEVHHYKQMVKTYRFCSLTGMKQRRDFEHETLSKFTNQRFYLAMYDIDGLHAVNREKGYAEGDALVRQVANDISMTEGIWEVYRVGGDEFFALYFGEPTAIIQNATMGVVYSCDYDTFTEMTAAVDREVTTKKAESHRRRDD